jgi:hypothetical protein
MDTISGMREDYRRAWEAECEYWRRLQARFWEFMAQFENNDPLPPPQSFRPGH